MFVKKEENKVDTWLPDQELLINEWISKLWNIVYIFFQVDVFFIVSHKTSQSEVLSFLKITKEHCL